MAMKISRLDVNPAYDPDVGDVTEVTHVSDVSDLSVDEAEASTAAACLFHAMGDRSRLTILRHLLLGEHKVVELTAHLGLAQSTVSKHLACLRDCGLVSSRPDGRSSMFSLTQPVETARVLDAAEGLLAATGDAVVSCHTADDVAGSRAVGAH